VEGELCLLEVMRSVLLCMQEAVEGGFCLMEVAEVPEVMRCVLLCILESCEGCARFAGGVGGSGRAGGDSLCAALLLEAVEGARCLLEGS